MSVYLMAGTLLLLTGAQAYMPYFVKKTEVFGIYVPEPYTQQPALLKMKKRYAVFVAAVGAASVVFYVAKFAGGGATEERIVLWGIALQFGLILLSIMLYFFFHLKVKEEKRQRKWTAGKKEKVIVDLQFRRDLEMVSGMAFLLPMLITAGLFFYTLSLYSSLPEQIPVHWGPSGIADRFTEKTRFTSISLLLVLLVLQTMFYFINRSMKESGAKIRASSRKHSRQRELIMRKYGSVVLFIATVSTSLLFSNLQLSIIHRELGGALWVMGLLIGFLILLMGAIAFYIVQVAKAGTDLEDLPADPGVNDADDDRHWKAGMFYFNSEDPSVLVEKRFGIGWTVNFGNLKSWLIFLLPLSILLGFAFAL